LVNGTPTSFFSSSHGLRQGNPLSPLLFVIVMKASAAAIVGLLLGFYVGTKFDISHLLLANNTLIISGVDRSPLSSAVLFFMFCGRLRLKGQFGQV
jgi:hypothetical protein